ncbi:MAG: prepilin-type N-terminal cleavage/methylation domain-containing protein [bacterium]|nr:prepilin-type N-terminal cleavage/methylation domain-containing protein [bacterium]
MFNKKGFTLIELLIVVAIIAILAAIAIPNFLAAQTRSKVSTAMKGMQSLATAIESYHVDHTAYPMSASWLYPGTSTWIDFCRTARLAALTTPVSYLSKVPMDVFNIKGSSVGEWDRAYPYWEAKHFDAYKGNPNPPYTGHPTMFLEVPDEKTKLGRWALMSFGPDQTYSITIPPWSSARLMLYDPTNGTVTNGDVWRFGP